MQAAARVNHAHLAAVYTAGEIPDGAFAVSDWSGGMTLEDRLAAHETVDVVEFLPNAAGVAAALAALHDQGVVHGAIDAAAIFYAIAHPAKLGAFGRPLRDDTTARDVVALATVLEEALTGAPAGGPGPSEMVDGLHPSVDAVLRSARRGNVTARVLSEELLAAPSPQTTTPETAAWSRRFTVLAGSLVALAIGLIGLGSLLLAGSDGEPTLPPSTSPGATASDPTTTTLVPVGEDPPLPAPAPSVELSATATRTVDPFGGGGENDQRLPDLVDGDLATSWRTETYRDPLPLLKPGVGVEFSVDGSPGRILLSGFTAGVDYLVAWNPTTSTDPASWEPIVRARSSGGIASHQLPLREGGTWVVWLLDLPRRGEEDHSAEIAEVRFRT